MSYSLILLMALVVPGHQDWLKIPKMCESCHVGHGVSGEKLLPLKDPDFCLQCHSGRAAASELIQKGYIASSVSPQDVSQIGSMPYRHPESQGCLACHSGHGIRIVPQEKGKMPKQSSKMENQYEYELCRECHINNSLFNQPASSHPVTIHQTTGKMPSLDNNSNQSYWIACSDCHTSGEDTIPPGVHSSNYPAITMANYRTVDGFEESEGAYMLCYTCHNRESILDNESFPYHSDHVVREETSCYTCHDTHASRTLPWLLTIEDGTRNDRILPDNLGRKSYQQTGERQGICYLSCHGVEHNGWEYGPDAEERNMRKRMKQMQRFSDPRSKIDVEGNREGTFKR